MNNTIKDGYLNRDTSTSSSDTDAYKISVVSAKGLVSKTEYKGALIAQGAVTKTIKISRKTNLAFVFRNFITFPAVFKKDASKRRDEDVDYSKFIFVDIDSGMTISEAVKILDKDELSYILFTSTSHSEEKHKFHIFIPTLKKITSVEQYKAYCQYLNDLFNKVTDRQCFCPSKPSYPSTKDGVVIDKMYRNDLYLEAKLVNKYKELTTAYEKVSSGKKGSFSPHEDYLKMIENTNPELIPEDITENLVRYKRDKDDKVGTVVDYYNDEKKRIIDKDSCIDLQHSNSDFECAVDAKGTLEVVKGGLELLNYFKSLPYSDDLMTPKEFNDYENEINGTKKIREDIQMKIGRSIKTLLFAGIENQKSVIVANEGVGKSTMVIKECKETSFIYAVDTNARVEELKVSFEKEGVNIQICYSNARVLENFGLSKELIDFFNEEMRKNTSTKEFFELFGEGHGYDGVKKLIDENNKKILRDDITTLITVSKLQNLLIGLRTVKLTTIVIDEFESSDFSSVTTVKSDSKQKGTVVDTFFKDVQLTVYKKINSLFELLKGRSAIILTTEYEKARKVFFGHNDYSIVNHTELLKANNLTYIAIHSTSNKLEDGESIRDKKLKEVKGLYPIIDVIFSDKSTEATHSHRAARGSNEYKDENTLVVGHNPSPEEQYIFYKTAEMYYTSSLMNEKDIGNDINYTIMGTKVNQSIGRNSGFRESGKHCFVLLPILAPNSSNCFKSRDGVKMELNLSYISSNIEKLIS